MVPQTLHYPPVNNQRNSGDELAYQRGVGGPPTRHQRCLDTVGGSPTMSRPRRQTTNVWLVVHQHATNGALTRLVDHRPCQGPADKPPTCGWWSTNNALTRLVDHQPPVGGPPTMSRPCVLSTGFEFNFGMITHPEKSEKIHHLSSMF